VGSGAVVAAGDDAADDAADDGLASVEKRESEFIAAF